MNRGQMRQQNEKLIQLDEKLIQQNDDASESALIGSYIGMLAFLTGLALVIFGLQMSRGDKITPISRIYYRILILVLVLPVIGIIIFAFANQANPEYLGVISLLLIPAGPCSLTVSGNYSTSCNLLL